MNVGTIDQSVQKLRVYIHFYKVITGGSNIYHSSFTQYRTPQGFDWTYNEANSITGTNHAVVPDIGYPIKANFEIRPWGHNSYAGYFPPMLIDFVGCWRKTPLKELDPDVQNKLYPAYADGTLGDNVQILVPVGTNTSNFNNPTFGSGGGLITGWP